jgi:hypothetical protein
MSNFVERILLPTYSGGMYPLRIINIAQTTKLCIFRCHRQENAFLDMELTVFHAHVLCSWFAPRSWTNQNPQVLVPCYRQAIYCQVSDLDGGLDFLIPCEGILNPRKSP